MEIKFSCGHCGQVIAVDVAGAGLVIQCPGCGQALTVPSPAPAQATAPVRPFVVPPPAPRNQPAPQPTQFATPPTGATSTLEKKYKALRTISSVLRVLAIVYLAFHLLGAAITIVMTITKSAESASPGLFGLNGWVSAVILVVVAVFGWLFLHAWSELIILLIDIEENTRATRNTAGR